MSEAEDLLALHGAVDIAVEDTEAVETRARVTALLPLYDSYEVHWYRDFLEWRREEGVELPPSVGVTDESAALALRNLSETEPGSNRLAARRLLAIYAAVQARGEMFGPDGDLGAGVQGAIAQVVSERLEEGEERADRAAEAARILHEFMAEDLLLSSAQNAAERWSVLIGKVRLYVDVSGLETRPCTGRLKKSPGVGPVATILSVFDVYDVDFQRAKNFILPEKWPLCMDFWCRMDPVPDQVLPPEVRRYDELVSTNCHQLGQAVFKARAILDFTFGSHSTAASVQYDLAQGVHQPDHGMVEDRGWLIVSAMPGFVRVETSKAVKLDHGFSGEGLAAIACAMGWTEKGKDMMYNCARLPEDDFQRTRRRTPNRVSRGADFPAGAHEPPRRSTLARATGSSRRSTPGGVPVGWPRRTAPDGKAIADIARQTADAIKKCVYDQAAYMEQWADRAADDDYGYKDLADDWARASVRMVVDSARILDLAIQNARTGAGGARAQGATQRPRPTGSDDDEEERPWTMTTHE